jgi:hypothetical protein
VMAPREPAVPTVVFVAGLTHSGSTLLDFLLSSHGPLISLGELVPTIDIDGASCRLDESDRICSCGRLVSECNYWREVRTHLGTRRSTTLMTRYQAALETFASVFGPAAIAIDSSKSLRALRIVASVPSIDLRVVHLMRDVRSWVISRIDNDVRRHRYDVRDLVAREGLRAWRPLISRSAFARFLIWYEGNRRLARFIKEASLRVLRCSYEELCFNPQAEITKIRAFAGAPASSLSTHAIEPKHHVALGNRIRLDTVRRASVRYDTRWLSRTDWHGPSLLLPGVMRYNARTVYHGPNDHDRMFTESAREACRAY